LYISPSFRSTQNSFFKTYRSHFKFRESSTLLLQRVWNYSLSRHSALQCNCNVHTRFVQSVTRFKIVNAVESRISFSNIRCQKLLNTVNLLKKISCSDLLKIHIFQFTSVRSQCLFYCDLSVIKDKFLEEECNFFCVSWFLFGEYS
jgi:hypothetical protein